MSRRTSDSAEEPEDEPTVVTPKDDAAEKDVDDSWDTDDDEPKSASKGDGAAAKAKTKAKDEAKDQAKDDGEDEGDDDEGDEDEGDEDEGDDDEGDEDEGDDDEGDDDEGDDDDDEPVSSQAPNRGKVVIRLFGRTDVGQVREHNEDNFLVADLTTESRSLLEGDRQQEIGERGAVMGVCDGMGGAAAGEVASQLAVDTVFQRMTEGDAPIDRDELAFRLVHAIEASGLRIFSEAKLDRTRRGMGTTATVAALLDDHLFLGQVGDSRGYILRGDRLVLVTRDQSLVNQLIEAGQLTEEEAETFEHNNIILQALGTADAVQVDLTYVVLKRGDTLLLCSDGLSGMISNDEIREVLRTIDDPLEACKELTDQANQAGGHDNVTVIVVKFDGDGLEEPTAEDIESLAYTKYQLPESAGNSLPPVQPSRRVKDLDQAKVSSRPSYRPYRGGAPEIEIGEAYADAEDFDDEHGHRHDPILIPTERAPSWLVTMMIVSAVTCVAIAGYYLLR